MPTEVKSLNEECGVFGVFGAEDANHLTYLGLHTLQHRGQEGAGIVTSDGEEMHQHRDRGLLAQVFANPADLNDLTGTAAIGHVRYGTAGSNALANVQPFLFRFHDGDVALAHNGNLTNATTLRRQLEDEGAVFQSDSDSEILVHLIRKHIKDGFLPALKQSLNEVHGGFAFLLLQKDRLIAALDPNGIRPLVLGRLAKMSTHHLAKLENPAAERAYEARLADISARIGDQIPTVLALPEQSLFALGYYQMTAAMNQERRERFAKSAAASDENKEE